jgi:hypothetical protein
MSIRKLILTGICFCVTFSGVCQRHEQFDLLRGKGDSVFRAKNYLLSIEYYEQAIHLPENQKPEIFGAIYYDMACVYSMNKDKENALHYLEESFSTYNAKLHTNPVTASHITADSDLDFVRKEKRFEMLLKKFYTKIEIDFVLAKEVSYEQVLNYIKAHAGDPKGEVISVKGKIIYWQKANSSFVINNKTKPLALPDFEGVGDKGIEFVNCTFKMHFLWASINQVQKYPIGTLKFNQCKFEGRFFIHRINFNSAPKFQGCDFAESFEATFNLEPDYNTYGIFQLENCVFKDVNINASAKFPINFFIIDNTCLGKSEFTLESKNIGTGLFLRNRMGQSTIIVAIEGNVLKFRENLLGNLILQRTVINSELDLEKSTLSGKLLLFQTYFSNEPVNDIDWKDLDSLRLGYLTTYYFYANSFSERSDGLIGRLSDFSLLPPPPEDANKFNSGEKIEDVSNDQSFRELMGLYSMFLNLYKNKNDIESYNGCFIAIKELQSQRLKYLYESNKNFKTYFRWKLSRLLKFYVNHGTDPAQAIVISLYIIFSFGVFFFFFPSDWDVTSKSRLISNFKDFIHKNEKGYVVPFFILLGGFLLSLINALTLSLNAFITLGFGNIPTHGLARYVCVVEGFIGWFLLSIFTVAMINQVL